MTLAGSFTIDPKRSTVLFHASSSVHPIEIRSVAPEGGFSVTDAGAAGSLVIPVKTLRTGQPLQDLELRRQIQARRYPTIEAAVRALRAEGDGYAAAGDVTFFGTTVPAAGQLAITVDGDELTVTGEAVFDVTDFGFNPPNILGVRVHNDVTVRIDVVAVRS